MSSPSKKRQPRYAGEPGPADPPCDPAAYVTHPEAQPDAKPEGRPDARQDAQPEARSDVRSHTVPDPRSGPVPDAAPPGTLLLREVPAHAGAPGARIIGPALERVLRETPAARCRLYVLTDLARPVAAAPLAAALLETGAPGHVPRWALLHALAVAVPHRGRGLGRRLLDDLLMELRADGVRAVWFLPGPGDDGPRALLESAGFRDGAGRGFSRENERTYGYDEPEIRPWAAWLFREL
ncbi:GNAT family N-acetyltransferase [Microbispora sp. NEAU-D428]|uniref:GNAT family N-acetyltransferase n=1 Tax=Microbispora sitophila TaxID=2771537 RepID=UPI001865D1B3|nr:GNAT family N-acetyltransferase [Microbispora sitophila]MBE3014157.1 GNAT family N-acetyltransferase [Microbispora sitophila]